MEKLTNNNLLNCYNCVREIAKKDFCNPNIFIKQFIHNSEIVTIDLMNLCLVGSDVIRPRYLWEIIHKIDDENCNKRDYEKDKREYSSFSFFLSKIKIDSFMKSDKPDFYIKISNICYDLEVRSVLHENDAKLNKIGLMLFGRSKTEVECNDYVAKKFKRLDWKKYYKNIDGCNVIQSTGYDCHSYVKSLITAIKRKDEQVRLYNDSNRKWLLLDTEDNICISEDYDLDRLKLAIMEIENEINNIEKVMIINKQEKLIFEYLIKK